MSDMHEEIRIANMLKTIEIILYQEDPPAPDELRDAAMDKLDELAHRYFAVPDPPKIIRRF